MHSQTYRSVTSAIRKTITPGGRVSMFSFVAAAAAMSGVTARTPAAMPAAARSKLRRWGLLAAHADMDIWKKF